MMNRYISLIALTILTVACDELAETSKPTPIETGDASHISAVSVVLTGKANIGSTVASDFKVGFQYSKSAGILSSNSTTVEAMDADEKYLFSTGIASLEPNTKYYYRCFVRQNGQDTYGDTKSFITKDLTSLLETKEAGNIEAAEVMINAKLDLTDVQYGSLDFGFLWGNSESYLNIDIKCSELKGNSISATLTNLSHKTQYWYRAYLKVDDRTFYGEVKTFTTGVVHVDSISLDQHEFTFNTLGKTLTLTATVLPDNATDRSVKWSSDNDEVATVDQSGNVRAVGDGMARITVTANDGSGVRATCDVAVVRKPCPTGAIDLGLSVYWATCNLSESGFVSSHILYGDYYAWGETETKPSYRWSTYKWGNSEKSLKKYDTYKRELDPEDDVAQVVLGSSWRMPTVDEWRELINDCSWTWITNYNGTGINGDLITAANGNSIFLPASGLRDSSSQERGSMVVYWSSSLFIDESSWNYWNVANHEAFIFYADESSSRVHVLERYYGGSIRPVSEGLPTIQ